MDELTTKVDELAELMEEFQLNAAELRGKSYSVALRRRSAKSVSPVEVNDDVEAATETTEIAVPAPVAAPALGIPITSPMNGIYYGSPSPSAPAFVDEGQTVAAGEVVCLIEAMKVFNEITSPVNGTVTKIVAHNGALVSPGEPLLYIG